mmetsp:Transcript_19574/g.28892  ORF Transcript_19574/g.28892 Transcript_19574/m.28892 type:complete len:385 (+) Transcript_19574:178-1332(+)
MLFSNSNMEFRQDQEEKVVRLKNIIAADPINWNEFLELDSELWVLSHEAAFDCSFSWILAHYPPPHVIKSLLERYQKFLFSNDVEIKSILNISLLESIPEVVQFIASRYSYIMNQPLDISGDVPLHRAQNGEIASIILQACPVSVGAQNHALELPLHAALLHQQHPDHIRLLVEQGVAMKVGGEEGCGGVLVQNSHGKSPFDMLNNQFETGIDLATLDNPIYETDRRMFNNLVTMVLAIRHVDRARASEFNVLHEIIRLDCPPSAIRMAQIMAPGQVSKPDEVGRYPLHLAAANKSCCRRVLDSLIWGFPRAVQLCDQSGKYPLHWGAIGGRPFSAGVETIYLGGPAVTCIPDKNGFYPFMYAASGNCELDTIYRLLRESPGSK